MRIQRLNLAAFGHFTERVLAFEEPGLHIIHGPNEAGKSSALRGLKALLYGIDERTLDNFLHANDKLRIHGVLRTRDGQELDFVRRKGRKNTLLTPAGEALGDEVLTPFLQGVTAELFETLFGIDHRALVQGGQEILAQKGEVGQALFSAALGSPALHTVLAELEATERALFLPAASKPTINVAIRAHAELRAEIRKISLSSTTWNDYQRILATTTRELGKIESELSDKRLELTRLQRIQRILPKLARRRELHQELAALGEVFILPADLGTRRLKALNTLATAEAIVNKATARLDGLQEQRKGLSINDALLEQADTIEALYARLDSYRKARQGRPRLEAESQQLKAEAERILKEARPDLGLADVGPLRSVLAHRQQLAELANEQALLHTREEQAQRSLHDTNKRLDEARQEGAAIQEPGSTAGLRRAIAAARKQGELDSLIQATQRGITHLRSDCNTELARLGLWQGELEAVPVLAVPGRESIQRFEDACDALLKRSRHLEDKRDELNKALADASRRLAEIEGACAVPTEAALRDARSARDGVWHLLRRQWFDGEDVAAEVAAETAALEAEGQPLPDIFEQRLAGADELSDRLRREAERVHALAALRARQEHDQQQANELAVQLEASQAEKAQLDTEWQALWAPCQIVPLGPREMRAWLDRFDKLRAQVSELSVQKQKMQELEETRRTHIERLNEQLSALGRPLHAAAELEEVLVEGETLEEQLENSRRALEALAKEVKDRQAAAASLAEEHRLAREALEQWKLQWAEQMQDLGLQADMPPARFGDFMESVRSLFSTLDEAGKVQQRLLDIDQESTAFDEETAAIVAAIAPELAGTPADEAVLRLHTLLADNRTRQTQWQQLAEQIAQTGREIDESRVDMETSKARLQDLCVEANCEHHSQMEALERRSSDYQRIKAAVASVEQEILEAGEGASLADLEAQAQAIDADALPGRITELHNRIEEELEPKRTQLAEAKGRETKELELMDGSDQAALLAEQAQSILASIRTEAERYMHAKLGARILRDEIERYRQENQGPLVKRASEYFSTLTLGSFDRLATDFNDKDEPVLAGIRPGEQRVRVYVEGMSSGTRDQLYLALRLASLEKYMESSEPMPFIVDDILVDFDDARSQAALQVLAELAERMQIILFTHHSRLVEQAQQLRGAVTVQDL